MYARSRQDITKPPSNEGTTWRDKHSAKRVKLKVHQRSTPYAKAGLRFGGLAASPRQRDMVELAYIQQLKDKAEESFVDVSQSANRGSRVGGLCIPCLTTSSIIFSTKDQRVLAPCEIMQLQGNHFEAQDFCTTEIKRADYRDLAGECIHGASLTPLIIAVLLNSKSPWWQPASSAASSS